MKKRDEIKLTPEEQAAFLRDTRKVALATLDKEGFPHVVAMNFIAQDGAVLMTSYGKAQKVLNIRRNPKVAVMAESGRKYSDLRGVMIRGECKIIEDPAAVVATLNAIRQRDTGNSTPNQTPPTTTVTKRVVLKVIPKKTVSWDHTKLGGRY
ncbi:MAG TPA: pyridoxamine 5'-phosphate oxidase family protein [Candidatus Binataceae bacterium]|nr:pyridoxamine 5'-phosphate oxidase family protein [Candidatus Binataceae bacterium]